MGKKNSKSETKPWSQAQPYVLGASKALQSNYNANAGNVADIARTIQGGIPGLADKAFGDNPLLGKAQGYAADVLGGKYLEGNPHLQGMIDQTAGDVTDRVSASLGARGRTGGNAHSEILGRELAEAENALRYKNYGDERQAMSSAVGAVPGLTQAQYAGIAPLLGAASLGAEIPFSAANNYANSIRGLLGNYTTTTQKHPWGPMVAGLLGSGLSGLASGGLSLGGGGLDMGGLNSMISNNNSWLSGNIAGFNPWGG